MSPSSELAARLEAEAVFFENIGKVPGNPEAKKWGEDLRAAAQAVREREWRPIGEAPLKVELRVGAWADDGDGGNRSWFSPSGFYEKNQAIKQGYTHYFIVPAQPEVGG